MDAISIMRGRGPSHNCTRITPRRASVCHAVAASAERRPRRFRAILDAFLRARHWRNHSLPLSILKKRAVEMLFLRPRQGQSSPRDSVRCMPQTLQ